MDLDTYREFLKRGGRSGNAAQRAIEYVKQFEEYLVDHGRDLDEADPDDLESYAAEIEAEPGTSAKLHHWGVRYYYEFIDDPIMVHVADTGFAGIAPLPGEARHAVATAQRLNPLIEW